MCTLGSRNALYKFIIIIIIIIIIIHVHCNHSEILIFIIDTLDLYLTNHRNEKG